MKNIIFNMVFLLLSCTSYSQTNITYFKAASAYIDYKNSLGPIGPTVNSDIVIFDSYNKTVLVLSDAAKLYKVIGQKVGTSSNGDAFVEYTVLNSGERSLVTYLKYPGASNNEVSVIITSNYPTIILKGRTYDVY